MLYFYFLLLSRVAAIEVRWDRCAQHSDDRVTGEYDVIVDDAAHTSANVISNFHRYFPKLKAGGVYFIEDTHSSYWESHGGGLRYPGASVEYFS